MKKVLSIIMAIAAALSLAVPAFAADTKTMTIPVTLTVVHTARSIDVTLPAALPVSVVDGEVYTADNLVIRNNSDTTAVRVAAVDVTSGAYTVASYNSFPASAPGQIALRINGCATTGAGSLAINATAFPTIGASGSLPIRYDAKVSDSGDVAGVNAANVIFTLKAG